MPARKTYTAAQVEHIGVPAYHPKGFWYDPVALKSRELGFFFGPRDPKKRWRWHQGAARAAPDRLATPQRLLV